MYLRSVGIKRHFAALSFTFLAACLSKPRPSNVGTAQSQDSGTTSPKVPRNLCDGRERCSILRERSTPDLAGTRVVDVAIAPADTSTQACKRREYWLTGGDAPVFLTADCEEQFGADEAGPAETQIIGSRLHVRYLEFQANDSCVTVEAELDLKPVRIYKNSRKRGTVTADKCVAAKPEAAPTAGDGSPARPLLLLHVE